MTSNALFKSVLKGVAPIFLFAGSMELMFVGLRLFFGYILNQLFIIVKDTSKTKEDSLGWAFGLFGCIIVSFYMHA